MNMNRYYDYPYMEEWGDGEYLSGNDFFDLERMKHSETGKHLMESRSLVSRFSDVDDPALLKLWEDQGVRCEVRETNGQRWLAFIPLSAYEETEEKYPVIMVFRPVELLAEAFYSYMIELAAQGECITLIYCQEDPNGNDIYFDMLQEILHSFPANASRVYTTGHSHYGELAMEFTRRHHRYIAGVMQQGDAAGIILNFYSCTQEQIELMHSYDMPLINVAGTTEFNGIFPINQDAPGMNEVTRARFARFPMTRQQRIDSWKRRLYCMRCPIPTDEEIASAGTGKAERELGFPVDRSDVFFAEGSECYIGDIRNVDGNYHFRTIAMENIPHTTCRTMHILSWSYIRRFARNLSTGEVIERY